MQNTNYFTNFGAYLLKEMKYDSKKPIFVKQALMKGTSFAHLYWDSKAIGTYGDYVGGVRIEYIDMKDVAVANPRNRDIQAQEYVIIKSRASVISLKNQVKDDKTKELIKPDSQDQNSTDSLEAQNQKLCTTYLKYFRKNGEVCYTLATKDVVIVENKPLNPNLYNIDVKDLDPELSNIPDIELDKNNYDTYQKVKFNRYPIEPLVLNESDDSLYGVSDIKDILNTQRYINQLYSMQLLNVQNTAWDKYIVKKGALKNQVITDEPGQTLIDHHPTGDGIKRMGGMNAMANGTIELANNSFNMLKTVNQTNDVFLGQSQQELSGVATSLYQAQNEMPIDEMRKKLWSFEEEIGKTLELFMKLYYSTQEFYYELDDATIYRNQTINSHIEKSDMQVQKLPTDKFQTQVFDSNLFQNVKFHVTVDVMQGSKESVVRLNSLMEALFINGSWNNMGVHAKKLFIEMYDMPEKDKFRALLEQEENDYISQLENTIQQQNANIQQLQNTLQRSKNTIDYLGRVNTSLQNQFKSEVTAHQHDVKSLSKKAFESNVPSEPTIEKDKNEEKI